MSIFMLVLVGMLSVPITAGAQGTTFVDSFAVLDNSPTGRWYSADYDNSGSDFDCGWQADHVYLNRPAQPPPIEP